MTIILKGDIKSVFKPKELYGKRGETVRLIADHGTVLIVEGEGGKFPVNVKNISYGGGKNLQGEGSRRCDTDIANLPGHLGAKREEARPDYVATKIDVQAKQKNKPGVIQPSLF